MKLLLPGSVVKVRSLAEVIETLDERGTLDGLPFMPEMHAFCGQARVVAHRAHKFCIETGDVGSFDDVVFLEGTRCNGSDHLGCQRQCLIFWKEAWLETGAPDTRGHTTPTLSPTLEDLRKYTVQGEYFFCQSSELPKIARILPWWHVSQYWKDLRYHHANPFGVVASLWLLLGTKLRTWRRRLRGSRSAAELKKIPRPKLGLQPGDRVRVKTLDQIEKLLDPQGRDRGMAFTPDMHEFCGKTFRVQSRVERVILEHDPKMYHLTDSVILEGVACSGACRRLCTRNSCLFWRESWLERT